MEDIEIHMLICKKDLQLALDNFRSFQKYKEFENMPIFLHDDGSLDDDCLNQLNDIKNTTIISRKYADEQIGEYIKNYPRCMYYRFDPNPINLWHKIKLFDYMYFSKSKKVLGLDTDLLFMRYPENIIRLLKTNTPFYFPDVTSAYCFNEPKDEVQVLPNVNTGLIFIPSLEYYNLDDIEFALTNLLKNNINYFPSWIEQSAFAHMFYKNGNYVSLDYTKHSIPYFREINKEIIEVLHFVSYPPVRELYPEYLDLLLDDVERWLWDASKRDLLPKDHFDYIVALKEKYGFEPKVIYDIGACVLHWTNKAKEVWPEAKIYVFDAFDRVEFIYKRNKLEYHIGLLSDIDGREIIYYQNDMSPWGNSYYRENSRWSDELYGKDSEKLLKTITVETVVKNKKFQYPDIIKMDVQGCEVDILKGMISLLSNCKHLIVELQHTNYNDGAPLAVESIPFIESLGFTLVTPLFCNNGPDGDYHFIKYDMENGICLDEVEQEFRNP